MTELEYIAELHRRFIVNIEEGTFTRRSNQRGGGKAGTLIGKLDKGYLRAKVFGKLELVHRLVWLCAYARWPINQLDHINRVRHDNRISNLREVTTAQNQQNASKRSTNKSGHIGVSWVKSRGKWMAGIKVDGKQINLGSFVELKSAISARKAGEQKYFTHAPA